MDKKYLENDLHTGQARVLMYLHRNQSEVVYQKDIEAFFQIRGGTVTGMIDTLQNYEYIQRIDSEIDKRKKRIVLTPKGEEVALSAVKTTQDMENNIYELLTGQELLVFQGVVEKMNKFIDEEEAN
ncbi:transcriptional regulator, MarR-family [Acholeplasma laidlawii PG-8A]|uniref:Transcriptional regulator, MarR-family n=2 Tax=Acholeplasma laidlawii TaxID=2148 RepID=A9NFA7_ACHLI|nr:transcriptional regulator, MarR-family [Acholeplasma laidlawii PG-8A]